MSSSAVWFYPVFIAEELTAALEEQTAAREALVDAEMQSFGLMHGGPHSKQLSGLPLVVLQGMCLGADKHKKNTKIWQSSNLIQC